MRNLVGAMLLLIIFATGFYLAQLYSDISAMIEQRREALTSAIYSAPATIRPGDDIVRTGLLDRLNHLSYTQAAVPASPGEYASAPGLITIYTRSFTLAGADYPGAIVRVALDGVRVTNVIDSFGVSGHSAALEPEVIGRLLPGAPAERWRCAWATCRHTWSMACSRPRTDSSITIRGSIRFASSKRRSSMCGSHRLSQGASTLTQQLARTFMDRHERSFARKLRELAVALVLEMRLSKNEILERYINDVPMGEYDGTPIEGMPLAARYFFNKDLREVTPAEAATLIGMIQAPTLYDPRRHPESAACGAIPCWRDARCGRDRREPHIARARAAGRCDQAAGAAPRAILHRLCDAFVKRFRRLAGISKASRFTPRSTRRCRQSGAGAIEENLARLEKTHARLRRKRTKTTAGKRDGRARRREAVRSSRWSADAIMRQPVQSRG